MLLKYRVAVPNLIKIVQDRAHSYVLDTDWPYHGFDKDKSNQKSANEIVEIWLGYIKMLFTAEHFNEEVYLNIQRLTSDDFLPQPDEIYLEVFNATINDCLNRPDAVIGKIPFFNGWENDKFLISRDLFNDRESFEFTAAQMAGKVAEMIEKYERERS